MMEIFSRIFGNYWQRRRRRIIDSSVRHDEVMVSQVVCLLFIAILIGGECWILPFCWL